MKNPFAALFGKSKKPADAPIAPESVATPQAQQTDVVSEQGLAQATSESQPSAIPQAPAINDPSVSMSSGPAATDVSQPQPSGPVPGIINDISQQPTTPVENNSPSQPTPPPESY